MKELLINYLLKNKISHKDEILRFSDNSLKKAHIYCKINNLSGQLSGVLIENFIKNKFKMIKNKSSLCNGDLQLNGRNIEIKISTGGNFNHKFNYVQLRLNHDCEYLLTAYYLHECNIDRNGELFLFKLNKENIKLLILKYGTYAHGTIKYFGKISENDLNDKYNIKEYALRPIYNSMLWNELLQFRIDEDSI